MKKKKYLKSEKKISLVIFLTIDSRSVLPFPLLPVSANYTDNFNTKSDDKKKFSIKNSIDFNFLNGKSMNFSLTVESSKSVSLSACPVLVPNVSSNYTVNFNIPLVETGGTVQASRVSCELSEMLKCKSRYIELLYENLETVHIHIAWRVG